MFKWNGENGTEDLRLGLQPSEKVLTTLEDVGQQLTLAFNNDGSLLASSGEVDTIPKIIFIDFIIVLLENTGKCELD